MKFSVVLVFCMFMSLEMKAQIQIDTLSFDGFLVFETNEKHVKKDNQNTQNRLAGKSFYIEIDNMSYGRFYRTNQTFLKQIIQESGSSSQEFIMLTGTEFIPLVGKYCKNKLGVEISNKESSNKCPYLKIKGLKQKLFQAYFVRATWAKVTFDTSDENTYRILSREIIFSDAKRNEKYIFYFPINIKKHESYIDYKSVDRTIIIKNYF